MPCVPVPVDHIPFPDDHDILWRYMDMTRFLSLLGTNSLYFNRADLFDDKWEGAFPPDYLEAFLENVGKVVGFPDLQLLKTSFTKHSITLHYVNCWHMNQYESAAMWKLYSQSNESIAIRTTVARLKESLQDCGAEVYLGKVTYCDYQKIEDYWSTGSSNGFIPIFAKRKSFEHEQEVRAVRFGITSQLEPGQSYIGKQATGLTSSVVLHNLIHQVFVSPASPAWFKDVVQEVLKRYGLPDVEVIRSSLNDGPVY